MVDDAAGLAWIVNLGCIELHPHPVRSGDLEHPDELRIDLDPVPGVSWADVRRVALEVRALLEELGLRGWPKTSGSRGMHVNVRIEPRWTFAEVRRAALAFSREVERRAPALASSKWWKEERHGVFLDYNQNAKDRTTCSAYSVRPLPDARVSTPLDWNEVPDCEPADFTVFTVPGRFAKIGDPHAGMDASRGFARETAGTCCERRSGGSCRCAVASALSQDGGRGVSSRAFAREDGCKEACAMKMPLIVVANSPDKAAALAGLERWKSKTCRGCRLAGGRRCAGGFHARPIVHLDAHANQSSACAGGTCGRRRRLPIRTKIRRANGASEEREARRKKSRAEGFGRLSRASAALRKIAASSCGGTTSS